MDMFAKPPNNITRQALKWIPPEKRKRNPLKAAHGEEIDEDANVCPHLEHLGEVI